MLEFENRWGVYYKGERIYTYWYIEPAERFVRSMLRQKRWLEPTDFEVRRVTVDEEIKRYYKNAKNK